MGNYPLAVFKTEGRTMFRGRHVVWPAGISATQATLTKNNASRSIAR